MSCISFFGRIALPAALASCLTLVLGQQPQQPDKKKQPGPVTSPSGRVGSPKPVTAVHLRGSGWTIDFRGWRKGYSPYPGATFYRVFSYRHYCTDYSDGAAIIFSPFYLYPNLPPFIDARNAVAPPDYDAQAAPTTGDSTQTAAMPVTASEPIVDPSTPGGDTGIQDPDQAVSTLKSAWETGDPKGLGSLLPTDGHVQVTVADQSYALDAKDFRDLFEDGVAGTKTLKLTVVDEHVDADTIRLRVLHTFLDAQQQKRAVYQSYMLSKKKGGFEIREFGSDAYGTGAEDPATKAS